MSSHFLRDCVRDPDAGWALDNQTTAARVANTLIPAFDRERRNRGLLGRDHLPAGEALVLAPCSSVHTWFMRFPIDIIYVGRDGTVLKVRPAVGPWRLSARFGAFAVIETAAHGAGAVKPGDRLEVVRFRENKGRL